MIGRSPENRNITLLPQWEPSEVAACSTKVMHETPQWSCMIQCETGTQGWDFVCVAVRQPPAKTGKPISRVKFGVMNDRFFGPQHPFDLPADKPTTSHEELIEAAGRSGRLRLP